MVTATTPSSSLPKPKTGRKKFHQVAKHLHSIMEEFLPSMTQVDVAAMIAKAVQKERWNLRVEITLQVNNAIANNIPLQVDSFLRNYMANNILHNDEKLQRDDLSIWWSLKIKFDKLAPFAIPCRTVVIRPRDHDNHQDDANPKG
ncbi:hypothetical protein Tco_0536801 [Tanacetum coccineum]